MTIPPENIEPDDVDDEPEEHEAPSEADDTPDVQDDDDGILEKNAVDDEVDEGDE